jgi:hypothetical protein
MSEGLSRVQKLETTTALQRGRRQSQRTHTDDAIGRERLHAPSHLVTQLPTAAPNRNIRQSRSMVPAPRAASRSDVTTK